MEPGVWAARRAGRVCAEGKRGRGPARAPVRVRPRSAALGTAATWGLDRDCAESGTRPRSRGRAPPRTIAALAPGNLPAVRDCPGRPGEAACDGVWSVAQMEELAEFQGPRRPQLREGLLGNPGEGSWCTPGYSACIPLSDSTVHGAVCLVAEAEEGQALDAMDSAEARGCAERDLPTQKESGGPWGPGGGHLPWTGHRGQQVRTGQRTCAGGAHVGGHVLGAGRAWAPPGPAPLPPYGCAVMASGGLEPGRGSLGSRRSAGSRSTRPLDTLVSCEDPTQGPRAPEAQGSGRRRNVLKERERRKRIAVSCERLRALLPCFASRREDMASILEMAVQFLRLAHALVPTAGQHAVPAPSLEVYPRRWHCRTPLGSQAAVSTPDLGTGELSLARPQEPSHGTPLGVDESAAPSALAEVLGGSPAPPGQLVPGSDDNQIPCMCSSPPQYDGGVRSSKVPSKLSTPTLPGDQASEALCLPWDPPSRPTSPLMSTLAQSWPGPAGGTNKAGLPPLNASSESGPEVDTDTAFLLAASPDWWRGSLGAPSDGAPTPADRVELDALGDTGPGVQELQDSLLQQWGRDLGCAGLALREGPDALFPDLFTCRP
ncbi:PREDICTED: spermatogenesis- and oogenesis-specific basic helix-loop-helix-containing protein 1 [Elephantulus edwardii]|uniref:spermatogenesis- and oogenesis-specific basic helix-loop-helix-containing protein 1 n=1 Tax=Elephantulus edwardii TaxID=28737 RepID=UPI0003F0DAAE|nr:PREDICTED: spermatogenesis- and oogenesis-specific basic helix-loop-helix-containing protein 1 [Elephantulus edwardii]